MPAGRPPGPVSAVELAQRRVAARTHGMGVLAVGSLGPSALSPEGIARLSELRKLLETQGGRGEVRRELAARVAWICEVGFAHIRARAETSGNIWGKGPITGLATYSALLHRLLDSWPSPVDEAVHVAEIARIERVLEEAESD